MLRLLVESLGVNISLTEFSNQIRANGCLNSPRHTFVALQNVDKNATWPRQQLHRRDSRYGRRTLHGIMDTKANMNAHFYKFQTNIQSRGWLQESIANTDKWWYLQWIAQPWAHKPFRREPLRQRSPKLWDWHCDWWRLHSIDSAWGQHSQWWHDRPIAENPHETIPSINHTHQLLLMKDDYSKQWAMPTHWLEYLLKSAAEIRRHSLGPTFLLDQIEEMATIQ